jgi:hypothetical protein
LDPTTTQKKGDGFGQTTILVFQHPKCLKKRYIVILPKMPAEIFCQNILQDILPKYHDRYFVKRS